MSESEREPFELASDDLVRHAGLEWMVSRICELRAQGDDARPGLEWRIRGVAYLAFMVVRQDGTIERPTRKDVCPEGHPPHLDPTDPAMLLVVPSHEPVVRKECLFCGEPEHTHACGTDPFP